MNRRDCLLLPAALGAGCAAPAQPAAPRCASPQPGLGRGFHLGEVFGRTLQDFQQMAAAGATLVRFGIALNADAQGVSYAMPAPALPELLRQLDFARATGIRLVLVLRPQPEPEAALWAHGVLQDSLEDHWRRLAAQLKVRPEVAAFDLVNEPHPPGLGFGLKQVRWNTLATRLVRAIRAEDPARTLVLEPSPGARPLAFDSASRLPFADLVYSVHMYEPFLFTHQRVGDPRFEGVVDYPGTVPGEGLWNRDRLQAVLAPVKQFADRHGVEIFVGEFGAVRWAPGAARERYVRDLVSIFGAWRWSWAFHAWREWHGWDAEMGNSLTPGERRSTEPAMAALRDAMNLCDAGVSGSK